MRNRKYYPFERNHYYFGKLLTAGDFEAEQRYFNDKRRYLNRLTRGAGIVAGLGVIAADDSSVILQAGCALDAAGREIVVPETSVIKLSTIEGYTDLSGNSAYLGIRYDEQPDDEVYAVMSGENGEKQHNRIRERYRLILRDESPQTKVPVELDEYLCRTILYADRDVEVALVTPRYLPRCGSLLARIEVTRLQPGSGEYAVTCRLEASGLHHPEGDTVNATFGNLRLTHGDTAYTSYAFTPEERLWSGMTASVTVSDIVVRASDEVYAFNQRLQVSIAPVDKSLTDFYLASCYGRTVDTQLAESYDQPLWIAKILLIRQDKSVIVDRILPPPCDQFSYNSQQMMMLRRLEEYYPNSGSSIREVVPGTLPQVQTTAAEAMSGYKTASGVFDLSIGLDGDQRGAAMSEEIMHRLGRGPVYVEIGVEYVNPDAESGDFSEIVLGDASLFAQGKNQDDGRYYNFSTAVKVLPERGTFIAAVRPNTPTDLISLRVRWFAIRLNEIDKQIKAQQEGERMILVNPDTIVVPPKGTAHISPVFINMPSEVCAFRLLDEAGGSISPSGIYTAPAREGVYEIRVEAVSDPSIFTHAFIIVTQKKREEK